MKKARRTKKRSEPKTSNIEKKRANAPHLEEGK